MPTWSLAHLGPDPLRVIVTGQPRSGTSFLAGLICRMGLHPGPAHQLRPPDDANPHGYYEYLPVMRLERAILRQLGGDFFELPAFPPGWQRRFRREGRFIRAWIRRGGVQVYKGNRALVLADLYAELFPRARWVLIERDAEAVFRSRAVFKRQMTRPEWEAAAAARMARCEASRPAAGCLRIRYEDFSADPVAAARRVADHIGVRLGEAELRACAAFFQP
ncbi:MAG: sulfotransferase [Anaerolineae bacterium]